MLPPPLRPGLPPLQSTPAAVSPAAATAGRGDREASRRTDKSAPLQDDLLVYRVMEHVGLMLDSRLGALQGRLFPEQPLRPPLSVKPTNQVTVKGAENGGNSSQSMAAMVNQVTREDKKGASKTVGPPVKAPSVSQIAQTTKQWTTVLGRKAKKNAAKAKPDAVKGLAAVKQPVRTLLVSAPLRGKEKEKTKKI